MNYSKLKEGDIVRGMLLGRKRDDGYRELYLSTVRVINGIPTNVLLVMEDKKGNLCFDYSHYDTGRA